MRELAARSHGLRRDFVLRNDSVKPRDILQQALAGQDEKVIAELRVLKVDLEQLLISDGQDMAILGAFDRRRPPVVGR